MILFNKSLYPEISRDLSFEQIQTWLAINTAKGRVINLGLTHELLDNVDAKRLAAGYRRGAEDTEKSELERYFA